MVGLGVLRAHISKREVGWWSCGYPRALVAAHPCAKCERMDGAPGTRRIHISEARCGHPAKMRSMRVRVYFTSAGAVEGRLEFDFTQDGTFQDKLRK